MNSCAESRDLAISSRRVVKVYDPELQIQSETIPFIGDTIFKFLGLLFDMSLSLLGVQNILVKHVCDRLDAILIR